MAKQQEQEQILLWVLPPSQGSGAGSLPACFCALILSNGWNPKSEQPQSAHSPWTALPDLTAWAAGVNKGFHCSVPFTACFLEELNICLLLEQEIQDPSSPSVLSLGLSYFIWSPGALLSSHTYPSRWRFKVNSKGFLEVSLYKIFSFLRCGFQAWTESCSSAQDVWAVNRVWWYLNNKEKYDDL